MPDIREQLADWIDTDVIAEAILEEMQEWGFPPHLEHAKQVWLRVLESELHDAIRVHVCSF